MHIKRYYPSSEGCLLNRVEENDLFDYIFHGFALVNTGEDKEYASFCLTKPLVFIQQTPEIEEVFRQKESHKNNNSDFIRLFAKLRHIGLHYGDNPRSWAMIKKELAKDDNKNTVDNYPVTIKNMIERMFPGYIPNQQA